MKTVYIHYNGDDLITPEPQKDFWINYRGENMARMFLIAASSWERKGWNVLRIKGEPEGTPGTFHFTNRLAEPSKNFPVKYWNVWHKLATVAPCWFAVASVVNFNFGSWSADYIERQCKDGEAINLMRGFVWSCCACYVTPKFVEDFIKHVHGVDAGRYDHKLTPCQVYSDEHVVRDLMADRIRQVSILDNAFVSTEHRKANMVHFPKSGIQRGIEQFPAI